MNEIGQFCHLHDFPLLELFVNFKMDGRTPSHKKQNHFYFIFCLLRPWESHVQTNRNQYEKKGNLGHLNPIYTGRGGGGISPPQAVRRTFRYEGKVRGSCNYTLNSSFVITEHLKLVSVQKNFPTARGRTLKFGG